MKFSVTPSFSNCLQLCISVPPNRSTRSHRQGQAIYTPGPKFGNFSESLHPRSACSASLGLRIVLLVASCLPPLVSVAVNGFQHRRCHRSELITELGYEFDPLCIIFTSNSEHKVNAMFLTMYEINLSSKTSIRLCLIRKFRVRFPPNSSRTDRVVEIVLTDLA